MLPVIQLTLEDLTANPPRLSAIQPGPRTVSRRTVCRECPVQAPCLQPAMADSDLEGVWAGTTAKERRQMRRARVA